MSAMHTHKEGPACSGLCCTQIVDFGVTIGKTQILRDVNLHIHCGELTALVGPNGAGKSTLLKAILGETAHTGKLNYLDEKGKHTGRPVIGYVPQHLDFDTGGPTSVLDLYLACRSRFPAWLAAPAGARRRAEACLTAAQAQGLIDRRLGALSGGELQRVLLALALEPLPDLLLLDEPVSGIDQQGMALFYETVSRLRREFDLSIILVSHDLELVARYADRVVVLQGTVQRVGEPGEVFADREVRRVLGLDLPHLAQEGGNA